METVKTKQTSLDMTQGSIIKNLVIFAVPLILSDFLQQLFNVVDSIIVGQYVGKLALAAVGGVSTITLLVVGIASGIAIGATVVISRAFGAKDQERMNEAADTICKLSLYIAIALTVLSFFLIDPLLKLCAMPEDIYPIAKSYLIVYFMGTPALVFFNIFSGILKAIGNSVKPLIALSITAVSNIAMDLAFIIVFKMGVFGAALATILAQYVSAIAIFIMLLREPAFAKPLIRKGRMNTGYIRDIFIVGTPTCIQKIVLMLSNIFVWSYINVFGSDATAAWGIYNKLDLFVINIVLGLSVALTTYTAQHVGADKKDRIFKGTLVCQALTYILLIVYIAVVLSVPQKINGLFTDDPEIIKIGTEFLKLLLPYNMFNVVTHNVSGNLKGRDHSVAATVILLSCYVALRQLLLYFWAGPAGTMKAFINVWRVTWITACMISVVYLLYLKRKEGF